MEMNALKVAPVIAQGTDASFSFVYDIPAHRNDPLWRAFHTADLAAHDASAACSKVLQLAYKTMGLLD